jgi:hypothetical protein
LPTLFRFWRKSKLSLDAALQELIDGNRRFASGPSIGHEQDQQSPISRLPSVAPVYLDIGTYFANTLVKKDQELKKAAPA